jgi:mannose-1-phosphate guanylyltransferase
MYALILAGGSGTRLWPYSRSAMPKQFLALRSERTMLQETVDRVLPLISADKIYIATGEAYADVVAEQLPDVPRENILIEPVGRGTAPCIGYAALQLRKRDPEAVMAVLSADHSIERAEVFCAALASASEIARSGKLVTLGIAPREPSTGYGYIHRGEKLADLSNFEAYSVAAFVEKPDRARAESYVASGEYDWNAGIFIWRADVLLEQLALFQPDMVAQLAQIDLASGTPEANEVLNTVWPNITNIAIDVAVMEKTQLAAVIPVDIGWSDVGDWSALADVLPHDQQGNAVVGPHIGLETKNSLIFSPRKRIVATIDVEDLIIVDTDDVLLICPRSRAQDVKNLVAEVRASEHKNKL